MTVQTIETILSTDNIISTLDPISTILFYDIDNTLLRTKTDIGSDEWVRWQEKLLNDKNNKHLVAKTKIHIYELYQKWLTISNCDVELLEPEMPTLINKYCDSGFKIVLITARHKSMADITFNQVSKYYDLNKFYGHDISFANDKHLYKHGIFFADGANKGSCIGELLNLFNERLQFSPNVIVFTDDSKQETTNVSNELNHLTKIIFHYVYCLKFQKIFDDLDKDYLHRKWTEFNVN